jgi:hypothetical protein
MLDGGTVADIADEANFTDLLNKDQIISRNFYTMMPSNTFVEWAKTFGIARYEIIYWAELGLLRMGAANDERMPIYSVGFLEEKHLIAFKLRWM